jgi:monofunctional glycosyltransferase
MARLIGRFVLIAVGALLAFHAVVAVGLIYLRILPPLVTTVQVQRQIEAIAAGEPLGRQYRYRPIDQVSRHLPRAVVAAEDTRFRDHRGFDWECIREQREVRRDGGEPRGCSTITQQLVKNLFLTTHRSWVRKGVETSLTPLAEVILGKDRILELYVNVIEWGPGVFGAEAAARHHYDSSAAELSRAQAAGLAAIIPAPRTRLPERVGWYQQIILRRMTQMGW